MEGREIGKKEEDADCHGRNDGERACGSAAHREDPPAIDHENDKAREEQRVQQDENGNLNDSRRRIAS
jgi:hypothetical protein